MFQKKHRPIWLILGLVVLVSSFVLLSTLIEFDVASDSATAATPTVLHQSIRVEHT